MSSKYSIDTLRQSVQKNIKKYEAIALSMTISFEIEDFINARGISKKELAEAAGVSPSYLSQVFSGDKLFNLSMLAGISQKYKVRFNMEICDTKSYSLPMDTELLDKQSKGNEGAKIYQLPNSFRPLAKTDPQTPERAG